MMTHGAPSTTLEEIEHQNVLDLVNEERRSVGESGSGQDKYGNLAMSRECLQAWNSTEFGKKWGDHLLPAGPGTAVLDDREGSTFHFR